MFTPTRIKRKNTAMASIRLNSIEETYLLGGWLAKNLSTSNVNALFLHGPLGCGKTTLIRALASNLSGAENCEISSPSFTIYNSYPTNPPIVHCDLYRCQYSLPQDILVFSENPKIILVVEWGEYYPEKYRPNESLDIFFKIENDCRCLTFVEHGEFAHILKEKIFLNVKNLQDI